MNENIREKIVFSNNQELLEVLTLIGQKHQPLTLESTVEKKATKKSRETKQPFSEIFKGAIYCTKKEYVAIYHEYEKAINNRIEKKTGEKGNFEAGSLPWGKWYKELLVIEHKENFYLRYYQSLNVNYKFSEYVMHYENGEVLPDDLEKRYWAEFAPKSGDELGTRVVKFAGITRTVVDGKVLIRDGFKNREDKGSILDWHTLAEKTVKERTK